MKRTLPRLRLASIVHTLGLARNTLIDSAGCKPDLVRLAVDHLDYARDIAEGSPLPICCGCGRVIGTHEVCNSTGVRHDNAECGSCYTKRRP